MQRGAILAITNPYLVEVASYGSNRETLLLVENPKQIEKLGECPALGFCKKKGCRLPCDKRLRETYCRHHLGIMYAQKSVRVATGGADGKALAALDRKRRPQPPAQQGGKLARLESTESQEKEVKESEKQKEDQQKRLELALHLDDRRFATAEANESYVKFIQKGMKSEDITMSRVPQLGRGFADSLEVILPSYGA